mmetsp:Transcript_27895/g.64818  ORF Transcript_27895/g.64818 Transcript_27895/m.64818 type:complete len:100 (-) Transcript_27895:24-323(-)
MEGTNAILQWCALRRCNPVETVKLPAGREECHLWTTWNLAGRVLTHHIHCSGRCCMMLFGMLRALGLNVPIGDVVPVNISWMLVCPVVGSVAEGAPLGA